MLTFHPKRPPQLGSGKQVEPRFIANTYGDGYEIRVGDGINTIREIWTLTWAGLSNIDADEIENFFKTLPAGATFYWTPTRETRKKFVAVRYQRNWIAGDADSFAADFRQVFDNADAA